MDDTRAEDPTVGENGSQKSGQTQMESSLEPDKFYGSDANFPLMQNTEDNEGATVVDKVGNEMAPTTDACATQPDGDSNAFALSRESAGFPQENYAPRVFCYQMKREGTDGGGYNPRQDAEPQSLAEENCCCVECGVTFANIDLLLKHVQQHEAEQYGSDIYQGSDDMDMSEGTSPIVPSSPRNMGNVSCMECGDVFNSVDALVRHVEVHETLMRQRQSAQMSGDHECPVCHQSFINERLMQEHVKRHNSRGGMVSTGGQSPSIGPRADFNVHSYVSRPADRAGASAGNRTAHLCLVCGDVFRRLASLDKHYQTHNGSAQILDHKCGLCGKVFSKLNNLHIHMRLHNQDRPYACSLCGKRFTQSSHLRQHELIHTQVRPFSCRFCSKTFRQSSHLHMHERIHTGMRPYKCHLCDKAFMQSSHLRIHERTHSRVRPYNCRFCNATFIQSAHMRLHEKRHLTETTNGSAEAGPVQTGSLPESVPAQGPAPPQLAQQSLNQA